MDNIQITIRRMNIADAQAVAAIEADTFSQPWLKKDFENAVKDCNYIYLVATHEEIPVAYAGCVVACEDADITNIAVKIPYRRIGIAYKLLELLAQEAMKKGAQSLFLEVRESNENAKRLYNKYGFLQVGYRKNFYKNPDEAAILMQKKLSDKEKEC